MSPPKLHVAVERWPVDGAFTIARGSRTEAVVVTATVSDGRFSGRGEAVPYARYGETVDATLAEIGALDGVSGRDELMARASAGASRNAVDCAFWDLEAKRVGRRVWELAGVPAADGRYPTCYTLSLAPADEMALSVVKLSASR